MDMSKLSSDGQVYKETIPIGPNANTVVGTSLPDIWISPKPKSLFDVMKTSGILFQKAICKTADVKLIPNMRIRITCKVIIGKGKEARECGGVLEDTPEGLLKNPAHKYAVKCPVCNCEFSGGRRFHIQTDQIRGIAEFLIGVTNPQNRFTVELIYPEMPVASAPVPPEANEAPEMGL